MSKKPSLKYKKFLYNFFELDIPPHASLFQYMDPYTVSDLTDEEKQEVEVLLIDALQTKIEKRWLYGISEVNSDSGYNFLLVLFEKEKDIFNKTMIAIYLLMMDKEAPILEFLNGIIESEESEGTKLKALEGLYMLVNHVSSDENRNELFLSTLYKNMSNPSKKIRENVYSKLMDHFDMRKFTPNNDHIARILQENHNSEDYQKLVAEFKERVEAKEITDFSVEKVIDFLNKLPDNSLTVKIADCTICKNIPPSSHADIAAGNSLDEYKTKLETAIIFAYYESCVMRCPICGRLYDYNYHYDYYVCSTSDEDEYLNRIDKKEAIKKVKNFTKSYQFKKIITCDIFLKINY
ncbi:MAG: hypothetical protein ACTSVP_10985 [Candidatus Heimdallarchaeota archaeon]